MKGSPWSPCPPRAAPPLPAAFLSTEQLVNPNLRRQNLDKHLREKPEQRVAWYGWGKGSGLHDCLLPGASTLGTQPLSSSQSSWNPSRGPLSLHGGDIWSYIILFMGWWGLLGPVGCRAAALTCTPWVSTAPPSPSRDDQEQLQTLPHVCWQPHCLQGRPLSFFLGTEQDFLY